MSFKSNVFWIFVSVVHSMVLSSCDFLDFEDIVRDAEVEFDPKLVIYSYLSPQDTLIKVIVARTENALEKDPNIRDPVIVNDALVLLSDANNEIVLAFDSEHDFYTYDQLDFPIQGGSTYSLHVSEPSGLFAGAECTVPLEKPVPGNFQLSTIVSITDSTYSFDLEWMDNQSVDNYYEIDWRGIGDFVSEDGELVERIFDRYSGFDNDIGRNGMTISYSASARHFFYANRKLSDKRLVFNLLNVDEHYYSYFRLLGSSDELFDINVNRYTNIENGFGIFSGYQIHRAEFSLE